MVKKCCCTIIPVFLLIVGFSQPKQQVIESIIKEVYQNTSLPTLAHELLDKIGPRLVGSPKMQQAHDWAVATYKNWGIDARNEKWGE